MESIDEIEFEEEIETDAPDDLIGMTANAIYSINLKHLLFMMIIVFFLNTDMFIDTLKNKIPDAYNTDGITSVGTFTQLMFFAIAYILLDILIKTNIL